MLVHPPKPMQENPMCQLFCQRLIVTCILQLETPQSQNKHLRMTKVTVWGCSGSDTKRASRVGMLWTWEILPKKGKSPKVVRGGCKRSFLTPFRPREQRSLKSLLHHPNRLLHRCNPISHQCKRPLARGVQKTCCTLS